MRWNVAARTAPDCTMEEALEDPMRLTTRQRADAAHQLLADGEIDGWNALAFVIWGQLLDESGFSPEPEFVASVCDLSGVLDKERCGASSP